MNNTLKIVGMLFLLIVCYGCQTLNRNEEPDYVPWWAINTNNAIPAETVETVQLPIAIAAMFYSLSEDNETTSGTCCSTS